MDDGDDVLSISLEFFSRVCARFVKVPDAADLFLNEIVAMGPEDQHAAAVVLAMLHQAGGLDGSTQPQHPDDEVRLWTGALAQEIIDQTTE